MLAIKTRSAWLKSVVFSAGDNANVKLPDPATARNLPGQIESRVAGVPTAYTQYPANPEKTVTKTNIEAAREIARQLRLRDVGGIIVCDFIDMETKANRDRVLQELRTHLSRDRARTKAFAVSDLGLIEMTRQRVRQSHLHAMTEACPTCAGTGRVFSAETIVRRMERAVRRLANEVKREGIIVKLHPDTAMYLLEEEKDLIKKLEKSVGFALEMRDDPLLKPDEYKLVVKGAGRDITSQYAVA